MALVPAVTAGVEAAATGIPNFVKAIGDAHANVVKAGQTNVRIDTNGGDLVYAGYDLSKTNFDVDTKGGTAVVLETKKVDKTVVMKAIKGCHDKAKQKQIEQAYQNLQQAIKSANDSDEDD